MVQKIPEGKTRLTLRVGEETKRLAKSKAAHQGVTLENVVDKLLLAWVAGKITVNGNDQKTEKGG